METIKRAALAAISLSIFACSPPPAPQPDASPDAAADTGVVTDTGVPTDSATEQDTGAPTDSGVPTDSGSNADAAADGGANNTCMRYCTAITAACTGANAQYDDMADCLSFCASSNIPNGMSGDMAGNTLECRIYHAGVAMGAPATHCPHAGPSGDNVCGSVNFNVLPAAMFTRVDRMGMPAVSTALVGSARKNAYNDQDPAMDMGFAADFIASLTALHTALDDDLARANLTACSMTTMVGGLPECLGQTFAPGRTVASLVVPNDVLRLDLGATAGFPNGRKLADPVIDVTLAVLLLRVNSAAPGTCGMGTCSPGTLAALPLNPPRNDVAGGAFTDTFPYFHPPHAP